MARNIRIIGPLSPAAPKKKRVAAYARVSSGKDAMLHSLSAQVSYYSAYIQRQPGWEYAGVYADEALTGTKDDRPEFQRLLADCRAGKVDMVVTKSTSRLARNTLTMLEAVRELKALNIDVFFEKENIHSLSGDGELMLTILASFAQEESRSVSENCKWRIRKGFQDGKTVSVVMLGYALRDGNLEIVPEEAEIVQMVFSDYLAGMGRLAISKKLRALNIKTKRSYDWNESSVAYILHNEKYVGDLLLQKVFSSDHIKKRKTYNHGQLPMYYVKDNHEPIIDRHTFARVQEEFQRRGEQYGDTSRNKVYTFTGKIVCGRCGKNFRRKIANPGTRYEKTVWICPTFDRMGKAACGAQQIPEDILMRLAAEALGLPEFDAETFFTQIKSILIIENNKVTFIFSDGRTIDKTWTHLSRKDSWDEAARQRARQRRIEINERKKCQCKQPPQE